MGPSGTRPLPLMIRQCCTHRTGLECVQIQECSFRVANRSCMSCFPKKCRNKGRTRNPPPRGRPRAPTSLRLMTNVNRNIEEAIKSTLILYQANPQAVFNPYIPEFSPNILTGGDKWHALTDSAKTAYTYQALTKKPKPCKTNIRSIRVTQITCQP